jgi:hypothetical protein
MSKVFLLGANTSYDANKQTVTKNQVIRMNGYNDDSYVVYDIVSSQWGLSYELIKSVSGDFIIVDYSEKALAVFGDTRAIKDQLKALDGRFNPKLTHEGTKKAGWIFSKSKEQEIKNLLKIK